MSDQIKQQACRYERQPLSPVRRQYIIRLVLRCIVWAISLAVCIWYPQQLEILTGMNFFKSFSAAHLLWVVWIFDMIDQLWPVGKRIALGSHKLFKHFFKPIGEKINHQALRDYIISTTKSAYKVFVLWVILLAVIGALYFAGAVDARGLFMISVTFYVCDLICVLIWCPFRLIMKTRCCTTCRIFNWDHLMMFTPMLFLGSFFAVSLLVMAFAVWLVWEVCIQMYPERFWEQTNEALKCSQCTDKLCIQYCQKLRR